jgi:uncharacterized protein YaaQ
MGEFVAHGGFVVTTNTTNFVGRVKVDDQTLLKVAEILGIPTASRDRLISEIRSIYLYRGE